MKTAIKVAKRPPAARARAATELAAAKRAAAKERAQQFYYQSPGDLGAPSPTAREQAREAAAAEAKGTAAGSPANDDASEGSEEEEEEDLRRGGVHGQRVASGASSDLPIERKEKANASSSTPAAGGRGGARGGPGSLEARAWAMAERDAKRHLLAARKESEAEEGVPPPG